MGTDLITLPSEYWPRVISETEIKDYISQYIKGQETAIDLLAYIGHMYTLQLHALKHGIRKKSMPKLNCLLTAPTGCGKTFIVSKFAEALQLPYQKVDCSSVRAEGWHGTNLSEYMNKFLGKSPYGFGVLHLDEMDKIMNTGGHNADGKLDMQMGLLDLLDGDYSHEYDRYGRTKTSSLQLVNNCLIIMSGSFQNIRNFQEDFDDDYIAAEEELADAEDAIYEQFEEGIIKRPIGFTADFNKIIEPLYDRKRDRAIKKVERAKRKLEKRKADLGSDKSWKDRMKKLGFIQELASRILCQEELQPYNTEQLKEILIEGKESAYNKYLNILGPWNKFDAEEINTVIDEVQQSDNGLRDMESILFRKFYERRKK